MIDMKLYKAGEEALLERVMKKEDEPNLAYISDERIDKEIEDVAWEAQDYPEGWSAEESMAYYCIGEARSLEEAEEWLELYRELAEAETA